MNKFRILFALICLAAMVSGCATAPRPRGPVGFREESLKKLCEQHGLFWQWDHLSEVVTVNDGQKEARVLVGSQIALVNGDTVVLSRPVQMIQSSVIVPADFVPKVIERMKARTTAAVRLLPPIREVVVDAGHGGKDPGAIGITGVREKDVVLDIAKRLKRNLESRGIRVIMTRDRDEFISLKERTEIASRSKADLFISIHANASPEPSVYGIEVFSLKDLGYLEKNEAQRKMNHEILFRQLAMKRSHNDLEEILEDMLYSCKQAESHVLANQVAEDTARFVKTRNRGQKTARFYVLRNTLIPSVLVEVGFLSNPREEKLLETQIYRQKLADGLTKSLWEYASEYAER